MKNAWLLVCLLTFGTLGLTVRATPASAKGVISPVMSAALTAAAQHQQPPGNQTFTGMIAQSPEGKFVLQDASGIATFLLDDQDKAKDFNGKNVNVIGTLDPGHNVIHLIDIQQA